MLKAVRLELQTKILRTRKTRQLSRLYECGGKKKKKKGFVQKYQSISKKSRLMSMK